MSEGKEVIVSPPISKSNSKKKATISENVITNGNFTFDDAFRVLSSLGFEISHPKLMPKNNDSMSMVVKKKQDENSEKSKIIKKKVQIEKKLPSKKEEKEENEEITENINMPIEVKAEKKEIIENNKPKTITQQITNQTTNKTPTVKHITPFTDPYSHKKNPFGL